MKMKYFSISLISVILLFLSSTAKAQVNSAYSRFGVGDLELTYSAKRDGMGVVGIAIPDYDFINVDNPATLVGLKMTRFSTGIVWGGNLQNYNNSSKFYGNADFNGFTLGFPISSTNGVGAAFGIVPVTRISYNIKVPHASQDTVLNTYYTNYSGSGGISKVFISASYKLPFDLSLGAAFNYYFGKLKYSSALDFKDNSSLNSSYTNSISTQGLGTTVGILTPNFAEIFNSDKISDFRIGASMDYVGKLSADSMVTGDASVGLDTLSDGSFKIKIPYRLSFGASMVYNKNYVFSAEYMYQPWGNFTYKGYSSNDLRTFNRFDLGFEYKPEKGYEKTFWEQVQYRAGLSIETTQYIVDGQGINQYSIYGGFSIPLSFVNSLDIGLQLSTRGTNRNDLIKENFFQLDVGVNLGELWFIRAENQ